MGILGAPALLIVRFTAAEPAVRLLAAAVALPLTCVSVDVVLAPGAAADVCACCGSAVDEGLPVCCTLRPC